MLFVALAASLAAPASETPVRAPWWRRSCAFYVDFVTLFAFATVPFCLLALEPLVRMKLTSFRRKDQVHLLDLLDVGLIDARWKSRFPAELGARLQELLDSPHG